MKYTRREFIKCSTCILAAAGTSAASILVPQKAYSSAFKWQAPAKYYEKLKDLKVKCTLCPRECIVADAERGYCGVRENKGGTYNTLVYGGICAENIDPIEKKPLFHYIPGSSAYSIATAGCNVECKFCQNWRISQFRPEQVKHKALTHDKAIQISKAYKAETIAYTYSEPVVFYEYMYDIAKEVRNHKIGSVMISNGYIQKKPLKELCKVLTGVKIDLKSYSEKFYKDICNGHLKPVLDTLVTLKETGIWFEIVMLVIPTLNDNKAEIKNLSKWLYKNLGTDVPVHFTQYHPTYKIKNIPPTPEATLNYCRETTLDAGLHYVYTGNVWGHMGESTYCPNCKKIVIHREGFTIKKNLIVKSKCPFCKTKIPGVWKNPLI